MSKHPILLSSEEDAALKSLYADLAHASRKATAILRMSGMTSEAFLRADRESTRFVKRIKKSEAQPTSTGWLSFPKIISGHIDDVAQPERESRQRCQSVGSAVRAGNLYSKPDAGAKMERLWSSG